jgi:hypothetical protein
VAGANLGIPSRELRWSRFEPFHDGNIRSLTVVAGPTAVGKTHLLQTLTTDRRLREQLRIPSLTFTVTAGEFLKLGPSGPIERLILHYDILRPFHRGFDSHTSDPGAAVLSRAETISFLTLRTSQAQLAAQLDRRLALTERPQRRLQTLRPLYDDEQFVAGWYEQWHAFVAQFGEVTTRNDIIDTNRGYHLTPYPTATGTPAVNPHARPPLATRLTAGHSARTEAGPGRVSLPWS